MEGIHGLTTSLKVKDMAPLEFKNYFVLWDAFSAWMSLLQKHNCSWETDQALEILVIPFNFQIIHLLFTNLESSRGHSPDVFSSSLYWHNMCHSFLGEFVHWFCEIWRIELDTREMSHLSKSSTGTWGWSKPEKNLSNESLQRTLHLTCNLPSLQQP